MIIGDLKTGVEYITFIVFTGNTEMKDTNSIARGHHTPRAIHLHFTIVFKIDIITDNQSK